MENIKGTELLLTHLKMNMFCILSRGTKLVRSEKVLRLGRLKQTVWKCDFRNLHLANVSIHTEAGRKKSGVY